LPLTDDQRADYVEDAEAFFAVMRRTHQWDALAPDAVPGWLGNFPATGASRYFACRILRGLIYYSERDVETLLREALFDQVLGRIVRAEYQLPSKFGCLPSKLAFELQRALERTVLVPLTASGLPSESSPEITRIAQQRLSVPKANILYPEHLDKESLERFDHVVIVDDNLGSGAQFRGVWSEYKLADGSLLSDLLAPPRVSVHSLVLVGAAKALAELRVSYPMVDFCCAQELPSNYGVFAPSSVYWPDADEQSEAFASLTAHLASVGIPVDGWDALTYAVILHKTIPDWSLPALWMSAEDWKPLLHRKTSA
jgi:hypothetical protein